MILVESGLYIGAASDLKDLTKLSSQGITHVLTVDSEQVALPSSQFITKYVRALDDSTTDLLSKFDECVQFIDVGKEPSCSVLVHCHAGQSRSAAVVTAYLMKTHKITLEQAQSKLIQVKPDVKINENFLDQLTLFESFGYVVDFSSPQYKQFRLKNLTERYSDLKDLPKEVFAADPGQSQNTEISYRCRKCRRTLFCGSSILSHEVGNGPNAFPHKKTAGPGSGHHASCTSYFIEPVRWMEDALLGVMDGQLLCPKCTSKLGSFNWYGEQCSCGRWVTPAFQMHKNRVDEIKHINIPALK
ncbi:dual specificity protein phosphatase 12 [Alosa pseudoharengus]|uniref:dual specificity protein phosphatase 12 n=1 Tax=Alosa pseudoharengus TaxID=34774 RepID=UPI003F8A4EC8